MHIRAEHLHLFPAISQAVRRKPTARQNHAPSPEEAERIIEKLREDHDFFMRELAQAIDVTRELSTTPTTDVRARLQDVLKRIEAVRERLIIHNKIEEEGIYVWTRSLLSETEQTDLAMLVEKELHSMPPRFSETT